MKTKNLLRTLILLAVAVPSAAAFGGRLTPERLRCEYLDNPLGIDVVEPRLSWELRSDG